MGGMDDIFSNLFFGGRGGAKKNGGGVKKGKPVLREMKVSLEDVY
jgi:DnaJ-class molecular chaperone